MEENVIASPAVDRDLTLKAIDWKRHQLAAKIINNTVPASPEVMQRHLSVQIDTDNEQPELTK